LDIAQPSIYLSQAVRKTISTRSAATTCWTFSITADAPSEETGRQSANQLCSLFPQDNVFLNDRGIGKYVAREDWVQKKDWPVNVDKRNKNKKYATYTDQEVAAMLQIADHIGEALIRFLVGQAFG